MPEYSHGRVTTHFSIDSVIFLDESSKFVFVDKKYIAQTKSNDMERI